MTNLAIAKLTASALVLGTVMVASGVSVQAQGQVQAGNAKAAQKAASSARTALNKKQAERAVTMAETAVAFQPRDAGYRMLLGQAYLAAGRFQSAEQSFTDTLALNPEHERAALNLALALVAQGNNAAAQATLADYRDTLPAADFGLAIALAGEPDEAVRILEFATRASDATAKTRQNLALAYAMQGKWNNARTMALQDMTPDEADARIAQWAAFVRPTAAADQVATLLNVTPRDDDGVPARLALAPSAPTVRTASVVPTVEPISEPVAVATVEPQPAFEVAAPPATVPVGRPTPEPVLIRADPRPVRQAVVAPSRPVVLRKAIAFRTVLTGRYAVQIGAFHTVWNAKKAWSRVSSRVDLSRYRPVSGFMKVSNLGLVRVAIGGLDTRAEAERLCARIKRSGNVCFVRANDGNSPARWAQKKTYKLASR